MGVLNEEKKPLVAIVTGASSGIGKAMAKELHSRGIRVFAGARRLANMSELADLGIDVIKLDVTDQSTIDALKELIKAQTNGKLDLLFNNAGQPNSSPCLDITAEDAIATYDVNVFGVMRMVTTFTPMLIESKGKIINTGSVSGVVNFPYSAVYNSSKAALYQYSNTIRLELKPFGVDVIHTITGGVKSNIVDTRELPNDSLFKQLALESIKSRREMSQTNQPMSAEEYSKRVLNKVLVQNPRSFVWEGSFANIIWFLVSFFPQGILDWLLFKKFKMYILQKNIDIKRKSK
ncbi:NADPH-dependent 1-acyl dihydroxyacetone phosphate reductase [Nadsonia fulvescens var. elongata DSM 6958]|uniref:NADPH-dependent 1-acyl dihydroxyacetone phosphate reductase n=1 Tax=Nadsonia fulvescens var. elongata DSM 6958 TaxID=857566 RepID=A0A1E3PP22_9ASCO|nr:NADPH-dependent 1-acyl dihydroxyacetone phosphate reductase [Nadsonia fulvescens var. elongata DSM 6958]